MQVSEPRQTDLVERATAFSLRSIKLYRHLDQQERAARRLADQFLRAATSVGANLEEARAAESRRDFAHKHSIALKEGREALYWLKLFRLAEFVPRDRIDPLMHEAHELVAILTALIRTTKRNGL
ncbi:MAG: four helix bundle protein [Bacteroidota bacterium]